MQPVMDVSAGERSDDRAPVTATSFSDLVTQLAERARVLTQSGERRLIGVTGPPGVGKSTLCAAVTARLGADAVLVGMDAFHLAGTELARLGRLERKGAPDTFDVDGYVALLQRLRRQTTDLVYAPRFERAIEEPIGSAVPIARSTTMVITEGNYLLLDSDGWRDVRSELSEVWYLHADADQRVERLVRRHEAYGRSPEQARRWARDVDLRNADLIERSRDRADLIVVVPDDDPTNRRPTATATQARDRSDHTHSSSTDQERP